ncbi:hypothetical protein A7A08_01032 [Methyloligella halotolerans]|uniref:CHAT domain protein n=1 Tax=Methyloligella halotolerans TaxID=1177755 RepID=A0A1E2S0L8_9HYPH|nr:hypothetical protein [Methyloligella halotolerans]ODA67865.1 hypothetical protein A7A08_01032 [Methyloligella halotolerans]
MAVDESFFIPRRPIGIVAVGDQGEALVLRAILENLGAAVSLHLAGTPGDFLKVVGQGPTAPPVLIISGHGDETGFIFGEYSSRIDVSMLSDGSLNARGLAEEVDLPGTAVISTACATGGKDFAAAFLRGGASAYMAPEGFPVGADIPLFVHLLMHGMLRHGMPLREAFRRAQVTTELYERFTLYGAEPRG